MFIVPSGPPQNLSLTTSSKEIFLCWNPVDADQANGLILGFSILVEDSSGALQTNITTTDYYYNLTSLRPYTAYNITLTAYTSKGLGLESAVAVTRTEQEGKNWCP